jgi:hypothetical protein
MRDTHSRAHKVSTGLYDLCALLHRWAMFCAIMGLSPGPLTIIRGFPLRLLASNPAVLAERSPWDPALCPAVHPFKRRHAPSSRCRWLPIWVRLGLLSSSWDLQHFLFSPGLSPQNTRGSVQSFISSRFPTWKTDGPPIPRRKRFSVSQEVPPSRPGWAAKPIQEKYPSHGVPIAIFSVFGAASPKVSL